MKIDTQKQLEQILRERDERLKARANKWVHNTLAF